MTNKNDIYAEIEYEMFDEMQGEFDRANPKYKQKQLVKLDCKDYKIESGGTYKSYYYFFKKMEFPYG